MKDLTAVRRSWLNVVLYAPEIPHNTGSVGRTCVAVGAKLWLVRPLGFRIDDYYLRRAGLDYWEHLDHEVVEDWHALEQRLAGRRRWFFTKSASRSYSEVAYASDDVLVFGCESQGLPNELIETHSEVTLRVPIGQRVRSLNLSNCVAIVLYEVWRQHGFVPLTP